MAKKSKQWISVYRSLLEQPYARKPQYLSIWIYLLLNASYTNREIIRNNEKIKLKRGELVITYRELSDFFGFKSSYQVQYILHYFQKLKQIDIIKTKKGVYGFCIVKILNYSKYQIDYDNSVRTNINTNINTFDDSVSDYNTNSSNDENSEFAHSFAHSFAHNKTNINTFDDSVSDYNTNSSNDENSEFAHSFAHLNTENPLDFAPKNAKSEKALNIIYRNKDLYNKGANKNNNKEDFYFSPPFLKNSILSIFKEEYNESRGMDYIVLNEQKELSLIQGLLTAYLRQNGNSEYTEEKILDEFRAYFKKCLRIQNNFYKTNLSLSLIANKFNEIIQVIKKEGIEDPEVEAINREEFYNNLKLH